MTPSRSRLVANILWAAFAVLWIATAIDPHDRATWALENALVVLLGLVRLLGGKRLALSPLSSAVLCIFLMLHAVGAHYTYSKVPYVAWFETLTPSALHELFSSQRNHYDRFVHFSAGALLVLPIRELWLKRTPADPAGAGFVAVLFIMAGSMLYELIEWAAAAVFGGPLGAAYLGTQGDEWDAHKDMALASVGSVLTLLVFLVARRLAPNKEHAEASPTYERAP